MTDASPINSYLLFNSPNEFRSINQVELALSRRKNDFSESKLDKHILIRSLDDLKRYLLYNERSSITPSTTATFTSEITADRPVSPNMDLLLNSHEADHDHDAKPWDNIGDLIDQWNWPIESLYQTYHLVIVLDLSKKTFCVSRNGSVFFDRVPSVMEALLLVLKTIFACRDEEVALIKQWLYNHKFEEECLADILQRIWFPTVYVSILLVNAPQVKKKSNVSVNGGAVPLLPPDVSPLSSFCHTSTEPSVVPLLTRCDARDLIEDNTFIERLQSVLFSYESVCRECEPGEWREFPLEVCLEFIVNSSPEFSSECFSYMFLANLSGASFSSRLSFLDSTVRRKGIILSLISLNRLVAFDSPQLSSLTQFLSSVGGFVTNIDYYLSLCTSRLNADWGKRFEGARCLAQQIFVHLINRFPVASSLSQQRAIFDTDAASPLYDDEMQCKSEWKEYKKNLLKAVGVLRYNEGWSVQLDYKDEASPAHLLARTVHYFHRGTIYIYYEMNISASSIYRRIFVSGTKTLVNHFCSIKTSSLAGDYLKEFTGSWVSFFFHLRYQVHQWFTSEEVLLQMLSSRDGHLPTGAADKVSLFTSPDRIDYEWLNMCTVSSIAVYFQYSPLPCSTLESVIRAPRSMASHTFSVSGACKNIISRAMSKAYVMIGNDDLCFFSPSTMYTPPYVIQFFSLKEASSDTTVCQVAEGFECRVSGFLFTAEIQQSVLRDIADRLSSTVNVETMQKTDSPKTSVTRELKMFHCLDSRNELTLLVIKLFSLGSAVTEEVDPDGPPGGCVVQFFDQLRRSITKWSSVSPWALKSGVHRRGIFLPHRGRFNLSLIQSGFLYCIARRLNSGHQLLMCDATAMSAVVLQSNHLRKVHLVESIRVVQLPCGDAYQLVVDRIVSPFSCASSHLKSWLRDDPADVAVLTSLHTFSAHLCGVAKGDKERHSSKNKAHQPVTYICENIVPLLAYLHEANTITIHLPVSHALPDSAKRVLHSQIQRLVKNLGSVCCVRPTVLRKGVAALLLSNSDDDSAASSVLVSMVRIIRDGTIVFLLTPERPPLDADGCIRVILCPLNATLLHHGLSEEVSESGKDQSEFPSVDNGLLRSLTYFMRAYTGIVTGSLLWQHRLDESGAVEKEIIQCMGNLESFATEYDISFLHKTVSSVPESHLNAVLGHCLGQCADGLHEFPSVFSRKTARENVTHPEYHTQAIPFLFQMCALYEKGTGSDFVVHLNGPPGVEEHIPEDWTYRKDCSTDVVRLRIVCHTLPQLLHGLSKDGQLVLTSKTVDEVLQKLLQFYAVGANLEGDEDAECHELLSEQSDLSTLNSFPSLDVLPEGLEHAASLFINQFRTSVARYALDCCFRSQEARRVKELISGFRGGAEKKGEHAYRLSFRERKQLTAVTQVEGFCDMINHIVAPAMTSTREFVFDVFPIEFSHQTVRNEKIDPAQATASVFQRCISDDNTCFVSDGGAVHTFIGYDESFADKWTCVQVEINPRSLVHKASMLVYASYNDPDSGERNRPLQGYLLSKIRQVSQLHLLRQLRDSQNSSTELIPENWGDQFDPTPSHGTVEETKATSTFYLTGENVLEIPIYYKLQHQSKKILSRIVSNSPRLELINIFNREQCFVVSDDKEEDTFHYLRLVFVKDMEHSASCTSPSPPIKANDRCPLLVVQLFRATGNASISQPLQKLQDFCYFLALQELQTHINYGQHKIISLNDLVFLKNQRFPPEAIHLKDIHHTADPRTLDLCLSLLIFNLKESKFKLFNIQEEGSYSVSSFIEHYSLDEKVPAPAAGSARKPADLHATGSGRKETSEKVFRFVKLVDGVTDVLVSCAVYADKANGVVVCERFTTKVPQERYINGESEKGVFALLSKCVQDTMSQLAFWAGSQHFPTDVREVPSACRQLLKCSDDVGSEDGSILRSEHFSLDDISPPVLPFLIEGLLGALSSFLPCCVEADNGQSTATFVKHFDWRRTEYYQNNPLVDQYDFYIVSTAGDGADGGGGLSKTQAVSFAFPDLSPTLTTIQEVLNTTSKEEGLPAVESMTPRIVIAVSLLRGLTMSVFNFRDATILFQLVAVIVDSMEEKAHLLNEILLQRTGMSSLFGLCEEDLAKNCCGDDTNVITARELNIRSELYKRRVHHMRFLPTCKADNALIILIEGLYNRGLIVNYVFPFEDGVKVLFDEGVAPSAESCEQILNSFINSGSLCIEPHSALLPQVSLLLHGKDGAAVNTNCVRLVDPNHVPQDSLIACDYHRHVLAAHIIAEAQCARSTVAETLRQCDVLWRSEVRNNVQTLACSVVALQQKSKQIFASRVPDFSLRRDMWKPEDDVLDREVPPSARLGRRYSDTINGVLEKCANHLRRQYPSLCIINLDPNDVATTQNDTLLNRLRCRYGKVSDENGDVFFFSPRLIYAVLPLSDVLPTEETAERDGPEESGSLVESGLLIVEIGLQVVYYALDCFLIHGRSVPLSVTTRAAALFKENLFFDSLLYDGFVRYLLLSLLDKNFIKSPGQLSPPVALGNLVAYYPYPPENSHNTVAVFPIVDGRVKHLKKLSQNNDGSSNPSNSNIVIVHPSEQMPYLMSANKPHHYFYGGFIDWERDHLIVVIAAEKDDDARESYPSRVELPNMVAQARACLLDLLLDSTQQERLDATWEVLFGESESDVRHDVSLEECLLVVQECQTIPLHYVKNGLRSLVESLSDVFPRHVQTVAQSHCKEYCIHSLSLHHSTSKEDAGDASREVNDDNEYVITFASQKRRDIVIMANVERNAHGTQLISVLLLRKGSCAREITTDEGEFIDLFCQFIVNCVWCTLS